MSAHVHNRVSPRVPAKVPLGVDGRDVHHKPFHEETHTLLVNAAGALIALAAELQLQDRVRITNQSTGGGTDCRVAWRSLQQIQGRWSYGIALLGGPVNFWGLPSLAEE